ncbi:hypothetical protein WDH52_03120 [Streptomyces sp. TRM70308]|uniref:hypothetical protein n=1 Tax=Streptomyces sp. TRM70308 TaxID=3131932 RepID=UPI003D0343FD
MILERDGTRAAYFLVAPGSTGNRRWPRGVELLTGQAGQNRRCYVGVPALGGDTWPLSWYSRPAPDGRLVHTALLHAVLCAMAGQRSPWVARC